MRLREGCRYTLKLIAYKLTSIWRGYESNNIINSNQCYSSDI